MPELTIGELARAAGVKVATLRYYERRGLIIPPPRSPGGYRLYTPQALERVRFIKSAQALGFSLREIAELLALRHDPRGTCAQVKRRAEAKIAEIEDKIATLQEIRQELVQISARCRGQGPLRACPILDALEHAPPKEEPHE